MAINWSVTICFIGFLLFIGFGVCTPSLTKRSFANSIAIRERRAVATPFTSDVRDYLMMPTSTHGCIRGCGPTRRKKRMTALSRKLPNDAASHGPQAVLSPFPTLDPLRDKKIKNGRNKLGKGNRNQKSNDLKGNNAMLAGDPHKTLGMNVGAEKRGRKKFSIKKGQAQSMKEPTPRRLRQHMQHKKKVKQFLQKRIQEQIEERSQNQDFKF